MNRRELLKSISLLIGGAVSGSLTRAVIASGSGRRAPRKPVFDDTNRSMVAIIAELIIPTTDTPGAIAAGVPEFVEMMVGDWYTNSERAAFYQGLKDLDAWCYNEHGVLFLQASEAQRVAGLEAFEQRAAEQLQVVGNEIESAGKIDENAPFFTRIRELVIVGYYTSEVGARQEHKFFRMTPKYDGEYRHGKLLGENPAGDFLGQRVLTEDGLVDLAPPELVASFNDKVDKLYQEDLANRDRLKLIGKRELRRMNSWMCNSDALSKDGTNYLYLHPEDAGQANLVDGDEAQVSSAFGSLRIPVRVSDEMMPRTVAIPHGWGHQRADGLKIASERAGVNVNWLAGDGPQNTERLSGMSHLSGILVNVVRVSP